jgi:hypothetical protein
MSEMIVSMELRSGMGVKLGSRVGKAAGTGVSAGVDVAVGIGAGTQPARKKHSKTNRLMIASRRIVYLQQGKSD